MRPIVRPARLAGAVLFLALLAVPAGAAEPVRIAMLPIVVHSAEAEPAYLSRGLADMLSSRLERSGDVLVLRLDDESQATTDAESARSIGRSLVADYVLFGSFTQFGAGASLDVQCTPVAEVPDGALPSRDIFVQSGTVGEIIPKLDGLVEKITRYVHATSSEAAVAATTAAASAEGGPANGSAPAGEGYEELRNRIEALERAVYGGGLGGAMPAVPEAAGDAAANFSAAGSDPVATTVR